ncbi:MAG: hypothetical protein C4563_00425 [Desulfobulbus sp.]|nr:MAG: hypothetical protein C4563_00425 [Desulfobulbus sp.]
MHRHIIPSALVLLLTALVCDVSAQHGHTGFCGDCHTMHNSQDGQPMRFDSAAQPLPQLLRGDCVSCHMGLNSSTNLAATTSKIGRRSVVRGMQASSPGPRVMSESPPTYIWGDSAGRSGGTLAGGNFYWVAINDAFGHNVTTIPGVPPDGRLGNTPPGGPPLSSSLRCAGTNGCHGNTMIEDQLLSLEKAHHSNVQGTVDGVTVGGSYRFLLGVKGVEDPDWEWTVSDQDHNHYAGEVRTVETNLPSQATMSGFCARCHGDFHNASSGKTSAGEGGPSGFASPWIRHPNDYDMSAREEYSAYAGYDVRAPVARASAVMTTGSDGAAGANQRIIMCLTCHRAHGSPNNAMLRWNYRGWPGPGGQDGCQLCHTTKF